jgi:ectoine hydroxylase-related dioxygenase (phytanoyl-CoA dioxygenase family)
VSVTNDQRFEFDVRGYLHLRGALSPEEVERYRQWIADAERTDVKKLNEDGPERMQHQLNRPVSRVLDADPRFTHFLDHPAVVPFLNEFLGEDYRHIDNDLYFTYPGYKGGGWHRGVKTHPTGYVVNDQFRCPMVKVFFCMTDVGPNEGEFVVIPGSHRAAFEVDSKDRVDLPGQHVFNNVKAGDIIIFNEALFHNGRPNPSGKTRKTIIMNFGRRDAGVWAGYAPKPQTLEAATPRQREILSNGDQVWREERVGMM